MAKQNTTVSDLSGDAGARSVKLSIDGVNYKVDLTDAEVDGIKADLQPVLAVAKQSGSAVGRERGKAIRGWARENGHDVGDRGALPSDVVAAYEAAQGQTA